MSNPFSILAISLVMLLTSGCAFATRIDGPYKGKVIDADTREPIEGVVVLGTWSRETPTAGGAVHTYYDAQETVTDKNGEFEIKGQGLLIMSNIIPMDVLIFKAGYEYDSGPWRGLTGRGWIGNEESYDPVSKTKVTRPVFDPKIKVKREGDKAIIPLKKLTMEERKKKGGPPIPLSEAPLKKVILMLREIDKDDKERGLETRGIWKGERYE